MGLAVAEKKRRSKLMREAKLGSKNPQAKLTDDLVKEIRKELTEGKAGLFLARKYGVSPTLISFIKHRKYWEHI